MLTCGVQSGWDCFGYEYNRPTKDVVIRNVTAVYSEAAGCAIGSEMSGGMENITVSIAPLDSWCSWPDRLLLDLIFTGVSILAG